MEVIKAWLFFLFSLAFSFSLIAKLYPQSYQVKETELVKLETLWQESQAAKQTWLSQARKLRSQAETLKLESSNLNKQLTQERKATETLRISFEQSERDRLKQIDKLESEKITLKENLLKVIRQRDIAGLIILVSGIFLLIYLFFKFRRFFGLR